MFGSIRASGSPDAKLFTLFQMKQVRDTVEKPSDLVAENTPLRKGDLLRVFNSIKAGKELLTLDIDLELDKEDYQEYQKSFDKDLWIDLFYARLPVKLTRADGTVIDGTLDPFSEQGMEGRVDWTVFDFKRNSYDSTFWLKKGDKITVYSGVTDGDIEWQGRIDVEERPNPSGKNITLISFDQNDDGQMTDFKTREVAEVYGKTYNAPTAAQFDDWALYHFPAQLVR